MKSSKWIVLALALVVAGGSVWADDGYRRHRQHQHHHHYHRHIGNDAYVGLAVGTMLGAWWYSMPRPVHREVVVEREVVPVYVERPVAPPPPAAAASYWYYCRAAGGYYPHVAQCPEGWMRVVPQAPGQP